jgi:hypothetical protein
VGAQARGAIAGLPDSTAAFGYRLHTSEQINAEIRRLYRRCERKEISEIAPNRRVDALKTLRSGMADPVEQPSGHGPASFVIRPVASGTHLSKEACSELLASGRLPEGALITLLEPPVEPANVVPLGPASRIGVRGPNCVRACSRAV